jgi:hypothetical protein
MPAAMTVTSALRTSLHMLADVIAPATGAWWLIGSAAMALHGCDSLEVGDIDVLLSVEDAAALLERCAVPPLIGSGNALFRSQVFGRWTAPALTVEIMGGLHVRSGERWIEVRPQTREAVAFDGATLFIPSIGEMIAMCQLFGRPKDRAREAVLRML